MKKMISIFLLVTLTFSLTSCDFLYPIAIAIDKIIDNMSYPGEYIYVGSFEEYLDHVPKNVGYSSLGVDQPDGFIPSLTFFEDFEYIAEEKAYYSKNKNPSTARKDFLGEYSTQW